MNTYVFVKDAGTLTGSQSLALNSGEALISIVVGATTPVDTTPVAISISSGVSNPIIFTLSSGHVGTTYGIPLTITTDQRVFIVTFAVSVQSSAFVPYQSQDPGSYQDLVGQVEAGKTVLATSVFQFDPSIDPSAGYVLWDLLDDQGTVYGAGNAYDYRIVSTGVSNTVIAKSLVTIPSDLPPTLDNPYQLRYKLVLGNLYAYSYENVSVYGLSEIQVGTTDSIELQGDTATLSLVTEKAYPNYFMEIYQGNSLLGSMAVSNPQRVSNGYYVGGAFDTTPLVAALEPYSVMWKFWDTPAQTFRESAALWIVNPSIIQAIEDVKSKINKARQTLFGSPDSQYPSTEILKWLRRGRDTFNGAYGVFTAFDMTNAMGPVREFWLTCAEIAALQAQYALEGEKAFAYQGAAISLDVDRTAALDGMISKLQSVLDNELKALKVNLTVKGVIAGDGSGDGTGNFTRSRRGSLGSVGLSLTPVSIYNGYPLYVNRI